MLVHSTMYLVKLLHHYCYPSKIRTRIIAAYDFYFVNFESCDIYFKESFSVVSSVKIRTDFHPNTNLF